MLFVGLGNMGEKYEGTRHNIGFMVLDELANRKSLKWEVARYGSVCKFQAGGKTMTLLKPSTFMNLSGDAVRYWMQKLGLDASQILVITDDLQLPLGKIRIRLKGSAGGHNGLTDVEQKIGTQEYPRMRMGIGADFEKGRQVEYVLGKFREEDSELVQAWIQKAADACVFAATRGLAITMNQFNS